MSVVLLTTIYYIFWGSLTGFQYHRNHNGKSKTRGTMELNIHKIRQTGTKQVHLSVHY